MRVRARSADVDVVDTTRAMLVWEPRRVTPSYAVPVADLRAEASPSSSEPTPVPEGALHPGIPFAAHTCEGEALDLLVGGARLAGAGFRPGDPDLAGYVILDFGAFDAWFEEDMRLVSHPREPYHRVDVRPTSRKIRIELDGVVLAESGHPTIVFETGLPTRYYLPREDVRAELVPSSRRTACAYKGHASYFSVEGHADWAWSYPEPLDGASQLAGLVAFYDDTMDVFIDGERREAADTSIAKAILAYGMGPAD